MNKYVLKEETNMSFILTFKLVPVGVCIDEDKISIPKQPLIDLVKSEIDKGRIPQSYEDNNIILEFLKSGIDTGTISLYIMKPPAIKGIQPMIKCEKNNFEFCENTVCTIPADKAMELAIDIDMKKGEAIDTIAIAFTYISTDETAQSSKIKKALSIIDSTIAGIDSDMEECSRLPPIPDGGRRILIRKRHRVLQTTTNSEGKVQLQEIDEDYHEPQ